MSFSKKFRDKSPIKKDDDGNPIIDFVKKGVKSLAVGPVPTLAEEGGKFIKSQLAKNINPMGYYNPVERVTKAVLGKAESGSYANPVSRDQGALEREDLLSLMMTGEMKNNSLKVSKYKPTNSKDTNAIYYNSPSTEDRLRRLIKNKAVQTGVVNHGATLGNYTIDRGIDKDGREYFSYYDVWDLNPFAAPPYKSTSLDEIATKAQEVIGITPAEVYGRVYVDEVVEETWQDKMENKNKL